MLFDREEFEIDRPFTVTELNQEARRLLEENFDDVGVVGEVSNCRKHGSGHIYFSLKDAESQLGAVCFRREAQRLDFELEDGTLVVVSGRLTIYEKQGRFQIVASAIEKAGAGELDRAFRALCEKLEKEGLFAEAHKKPLPRYPFKIAVVTSPAGAAVRDILSTLRRRWPCADVLIFPVRVQGAQAAPEIANALRRLPEVDGIDVVIVGRGGGSLEDLWAFNEESVARAIFDCPLPIISAVGHERDYTIADFVADARADTPTAAAEIAAPDITEVRGELTARARRIAGLMRDRVTQHTRSVRELLRSHALLQVRGRIENYLQTNDHVMDKMSHLVVQMLGRGRAKLGEMLRSYGLGRVRDRIDRGAQRHAHHSESLRRVAAVMVRPHRQRLANTLTRLEGLDVKRILERGYTICTNPDTGRVIRSAVLALETDRMEVAFHDGRVLTEVKEEIHERREN